MSEQLSTPPGSAPTSTTPSTDYEQPAWRSDVRLPVTGHAVAHVLTVPCFPELTEDEVDRVCEALGEL